MVQFEGKYKHDKSQNYDEFLKALGVPLVPRKIMSSSSPVVEVSRPDGDSNEWIIKMSTMIKEIVYRFVPGVPMETDSMGDTAKNVFTIDKNVIKQRQESKAFSIEMLREFTDDGMHMTMTHLESGTVCHRFFKRI